MMNSKLKKIIEEKTLKENREAVVENIESMLCCNSDAKIDEEMIYNAIAKEGEFLILEGRYEDFDIYSESSLFKEKLNESLEIIVFFEDDGDQYEKIERFVKYIYNNTSEQKFIFGIKKVEQLSQNPLKILLASIYPINQLEIHLGKDIYNYIEANRDYFEPYFAAIRSELSKEIGVVILPLNTLRDTKLQNNQVQLIDSVTGDVIVEFSVELTQERDSLDYYLMKLFYVFIKLGKKYNH